MTKQSCCSPCVPCSRDRIIHSNVLGRKVDTLKLSLPLTSTARFKRCWVTDCLFLTIGSHHALFIPHIRTMAFSQETKQEVTNWTERNLKSCALHSRRTEQRDSLQTIVFASYSFDKSLEYAFFKEPKNSRQNAPNRLINQLTDK